MVIVSGKEAITTSATTNSSSSICRELEFKSIGIWTNFASNNTNLLSLCVVCLLWPRSLLLYLFICSYLLCLYIHSAGSSTLYFVLIFLFVLLVVLLFRICFASIRSVTAVHELTCARIGQL